MSIVDCALVQFANAEISRGNGLIFRGAPSNRSTVGGAARQCRSAPRSPDVCRTAERSYQFYAVLDRIDGHSHTSEDSVGFAKLPRNRASRTVSKSEGSGFLRLQSSHWKRHDELL